MRSAPAAMFFLLLAACVGAPPQADDALYRDLGGTAGITAIVDSFLVELARDERIIHHFRRTNVERFRRLLIEQFCELAGGPCTYSGDSMALSHRGMGLTDRDFNALVDDLIHAMEAENVPVGAQNRLLALLAPMYGEIMAEQDVEPLAGSNR
ncbi:MAG: group 1 truncated hemoglobin [Xanthomonadales bacterium]|nr:group 1 truncated hemoglobin [Xanthomonadales bacterium]